MKIELTDNLRSDRGGQIMTITWDDGSFEEHRDGREPEDNYFCRDWDWVSGAIERAYREGQKRGMIE